MRSLTRKGGSSTIPPPFCQQVDIVQNVNVNNSVNKNTPSNIIMSYSDALKYGGTSNDRKIMEFQKTQGAHGEGVWSEKTYPETFCRASLDHRIGLDFVSESAHATDSMSGATSVTSSQGGQNILRVAKKTKISPGGLEWVPVNFVDSPEGVFMAPQVSHGLAKKGLSTLSYTDFLAQGAGPQSGVPAVLIANHSTVSFQAQKGQRVGVLLPVRNLPAAFKTPRFCRTDTSDGLQGGHPPPPSVGCVGQLSY